MRKAILLLPVLFVLPVLAVSVFAQDATSVEDLIRQLGSDEYSVREKATKSLIERGTEAVPALEKALESEDPEVRMRAGRVLRALRAERKKVDAQKEPRQPRLPGFNGQFKTSGYTITFKDGKVRVERKVVGEDGKQKVQVYEGNSLEELRKKHPELKNLLGGFNFKFQPLKPGQMPDWFKDDWFKNDPFKDLNRDMEKLRNSDWWKRWNEEFQKSLKRFRELNPRTPGLTPGLRVFPRPLAGYGALGVRAQEVSDLLKTHLRLNGGAVILGLRTGSPAQRLGLRRYDILLDLAGKPVRTLRDIPRIMKDWRKGDALKALVMRGGKLVRLTTASALVEPVPGRKGAKAEAEDAREREPAKGGK